MPETGVAEYTTVVGTQDTTLEEDLTDLLYAKQKEIDQAKKTWIWQVVSLAVALLALIWSVIATALVVHYRNVAIRNGTAQLNHERQLVSRLAFGSCTSRDLRPQPIWTQGVIPSRPDAWIWLGDMSYVDLPPFDSDELCKSFDSSDYCNCDKDWLHPQKGSCLAGDLDHVRLRFQQQVQLPEYRAFLEYMCPNHLLASGGMFPPPGADPTVCPRPILGVYDDHDYGINNANRRLPNKHALKQLFLDAIGESQSSPRRGALRGMQHHTVLNQGHAGKEIDVILLDGRYYRDPLPCESRRKWCEGVLEKEKPHKRVWCEDFLEGGEYGEGGSCCKSDEELKTWCTQIRNANHPYYRLACDPTSSEYGMKKVVLNADNSLLMKDGVGVWAQPGSTQHVRLAKESPICDVLGVQQRQWLQSVLQSSNAPLKVVASGSVVLGSLGYEEEGVGPCSGDDWLCYPGAQVNLVHTLANTTSGCVILLTGDFHYSDIKVAEPGDHPYSDALQSKNLKKSVFQVMASGMTDTTAQHMDQPCEGTFREDLVKLRPLGRCSFMAKPNFGMMEVDWKQQRVHLQIRDGATGEIAVGHDGSKQEVVVSMKTCSIVK